MSKSYGKRMLTKFQFICQKCKGEMTPGDDGYYCEDCGNFTKYLNKENNNE